MIEPSLATATPPPEEDITTALYRAAIGPVSTGYYLPLFTRFEAANHAGISWNTAAALSTLNWLAFRQLWGAALAYAGALVALLLLVFGIGRLLFQWPEALVTALALGFGLAAFVLPGLFGNAIFHIDCRKRMSKALVAHSDVAESCAQLARQASTRKRAIFLAAANVVLVTAAIFAYLQLSTLSHLSVMPQGALEAGQIAVGPAVDARAVASAPGAMRASEPVSEPVPVSEPASVPVPVPVPVPGPLPAPAPAASAPEPAPSLSSASATVSSPIKTMVMVDTIRKDTAKPAPPTKRVTAAAKPYFINVGLFAVAQNAERANAKLLLAQLPAVTQEFKSTKGTQIRVRVGPYDTRKDAQDAVVKIKALQLDAIIVQP